ncbi:response regulator [Thioalbus denitrificans]|uniref:Response regulator receiver domain-containing protein n=1 Tax=Thioalbus denitrificans TaxID=547122 RepID=A0A369BTZ4_9GAMM|nr:response regulator [Thioalbus denitrificans]RCX24851.1 response regulator receiver domain-containing protein [Thioalbus denitrificans]
MSTQQLRRILCVEDEPDIQTVARLALETLGGFEVAFCDTGPEAIERAPRFGPDLILLDVMLPEMDGPQTLAALRQLPELGAVPVVFMTAKVQPGEVRRYLELGAVDVIAKPFDPMVLPQRVRAIWERVHD